MVSTKTGFGSDMDIIFQKQDRIGWYKSTMWSSMTSIRCTWRCAHIWEKYICLKMHHWQSSAK